MTKVMEDNGCPAAWLPTVFDVRNGAIGYQLFHLLVRWTGLEPGALVIFCLVYHNEGCGPRQFKPSQQWKALGVLRLGWWTLQGTCGSTWCVCISETQSGGRRHVEIKIIGTSQPGTRISAMVTSSTPGHVRVGTWLWVGSGCRD